MSLRLVFILTLQFILNVGYSYNEHDLRRTFKLKKDRENIKLIEKESIHSIEPIKNTNGCKITTGGIDKTTYEIKEAGVKKVVDFFEPYNKTSNKLIPTEGSNWINSKPQGIDFCLVGNGFIYFNSEYPRFFNQQEINLLKDRVKVSQKEMLITFLQMNPIKGHSDRIELHRVSKYHFNNLIKTIPDENLFKVRISLLKETCFYNNKFTYFSNTWVPQYVNPDAMGNVDLTELAREEINHQKMIRLKESLDNVKDEFIDFINSERILNQLFVENFEELKKIKPNLLHLTYKEYVIRKAMNINSLGELERGNSIIKRSLFDEIEALFFLKETLMELKLIRYQKTDPFIGFDLLLSGRKKYNLFLAPTIQNKWMPLYLNPDVETDANFDLTGGFINQQEKNRLQKSLDEAKGEFVNFVNSEPTLTQCYSESFEELKKNNSNLLHLTFKEYVILEAIHAKSLRKSEKWKLIYKEFNEIPQIHFIYTGTYMERKLLQEELKQKNKFSMQPLVKPIERYRKYEPFRNRTFRIRGK